MQTHTRPQGGRGNFLFVSHPCHSRQSLGSGPSKGLLGPEHSIMGLSWGGQGGQSLEQMNVLND